MFKLNVQGSKTDTLLLNKAVLLSEMCIYSNHLHHKVIWKVLQEQEHLHLTLMAWKWKKTGIVALIVAKSTFRFVLHFIMPLYLTLQKQNMWQYLALYVFSYLIIGFRKDDTLYWLNCCLYFSLRQYFRWFHEQSYSCGASVQWSADRGQMGVHIVEIGRLSCEYLCYF